MVVDEVENDFHPEFVGIVDKIFEVGVRAVVGLYFEIVLEAVRVFGVVCIRRLLALAPERPVRAVIVLNNWAKVHDVESRILYVREHLAGFVERAFVRVDG